MLIKLGRYIDSSGAEYEATGIATHSESLEKMVIYHVAHFERDVRVCPVSLWVKQFTYVDDFVAPDTTITTPALVSSPTGIHKHSTPAEKIDLFLSLFTGREDVYAKYWENSKKGTKGYVPACYNQWTSLCPKSSGHKMKCGECPTQSFAAFDADAVYKHLRGDLTIGAYPMLPEETCKFLAFDFDGKDCDPADLRQDVAAIRENCIENDINIATEISRSGKGYHLWIFFDEAIPTSIARKFGSSIITYTMSKHHNLRLKTYDRLIPSQDTLPQGGFGNLIALPLQGLSRKLKRTVFVDESFTPYADQWAFLHDVKKYTLDEIENFIRQLAPAGELGDLHASLDTDGENTEKPWEAKKPKSSIKLTKQDFPSAVNIVLTNGLYIDKTGISSPALNTIKRLAAFRNPEFYKAQAMRLSTHDKPRIISCFEETDKYVILPRGLKDDVFAFLEDVGVGIACADETNHGRAIDVAFNGELRDEQSVASEVLLAYKNGILSATTAFGKTIIGAHLVASRRVNTLILVHRTNLLHQWIERLNEFLVINEEPIAELTPKGRKRKKSVIGQIGGGKNNPSGIIDVAVMQSLISGGEVKEMVKNYGMVIVDECHRVGAFTFEEILKAVNAKYVYGLTATPTRKDGHHPIIFMQCGKIRYKVDAKKQAQTRPFEHYIIPRFTRFQKPAHLKDGDKWPIADIYNDIQNNETRNNLIIQDVLAVLRDGRNPIILTERTKHVKLLTDALASNAKNVIPLIGGGSQKKSRETLQQVANIPENEPFTLVATGRYVGEGFDMPRLDTLFLAMPISWKGTVQQYAGRLHRLFDGKDEVQIYDYVDINVAMLERMYQKRLKGYASIGYKAKAPAQPIKDVNCIFDNYTFHPIYLVDVMSAKSEVVIVSPFLTSRRIHASLNYLTSSTAKVTIITKPPENYPNKDRLRIEECTKLLEQCNITVKTKDRIHQKYAVIDQRIVWYGSINLLSYGSSEESIMRIESTEIAAELLRNL